MSNLNKQEILQYPLQIEVLLVNQMSLTRRSSCNHMIVNKELTMVEIVRIIHQLEYKKKKSK